MKRVQFCLILFLLAGTLVQAGEPGLVKADFFPIRPALVADFGAPAPVQERAAGEVKSKGKAFMMSLLLPGWGERYIGNIRKSEYFMAAELSLWLGYAGFLTYRDWRKEEYRSYAVAHAQVNPDGKSETYYVSISNYDDIEEYNAAKLRQRNLAEYYKDVEANYWKWDTSADRKKFDDLRLSAARADNRATFVLGAIFANHLISAIDAVWSVHVHNRNLSDRFDVDVRGGDGILQPKVHVSLQAHL